MHDDTLDAHADNGRKLVRTIISSIGIRSIISPIGVGIIISSIGIGSIISPIVIWISIGRTPIGSTIDPPNVPTVGSIIVLCIIWLSLSGLRQVTQPCRGRGWGRYRSAGSDSENEHGPFHCITSRSCGEHSEGGVGVRRHEGNSKGWGSFRRGSRRLRRYRATAAVAGWPFRMGL